MTTVNIPDLREFPVRNANCVLWLLILATLLSWWQQRYFHSLGLWFSAPLRHSCPMATKPFCPLKEQCSDLVVQLSQSYCVRQNCDILPWRVSFHASYICECVQIKSLNNKIKYSLPDKQPNLWHSNILEKAIGKKVTNVEFQSHYKLLQEGYPKVTHLGSPSHCFKSSSI